MYPIFRLLFISITARFRKKIKPEEMSEISFYCRPWDLDMFLEMNNGRILTLFDIGRFDLSIRTGFAKTLMDNRWGLAVAGSSTQYRKRMRLFNKVTMRTQIIGIDEKWIYVSQSMYVKNKPTATTILRTCVTNSEGVVPTRLILDKMHLEKFNNQLPEWASTWEQFDKNRPWPPTP